MRITGLSMEGIWREKMSWVWTHHGFYYVESCLQRSQTGHYYIIESKGNKEIIHCFPFLKQGRTRLILLVMENGPLKRICYSYLNNEVINNSFLPKLCLATPFEGYRNMMSEDLKNDFSNFPIMKTNQSLGDN